MGWEEWANTTYICTVVRHSERDTIKCNHFFFFKLQVYQVWGRRDMNVGPQRRGKLCTDVQEIGTIIGRPNVLDMANSICDQLRNWTRKNIPVEICISWIPRVVIGHDQDHLDGQSLHWFAAHYTSLNSYRLSTNRQFPQHLVHWRALHHYKAYRFVNTHVTWTITHVAVAMKHYSAKPSAQVYWRMYCVSKFANSITHSVCQTL